MERKKSSGQPFQMRSGNSAKTGTPYPFLKGLKNIGKKIMGATPIGMAANALKGGGGGADDVNTKIDEIHEALVGGEMGEMGGGMNEGQTLARAAKDAAMTKKTTPMYHKPHHTDKQVDPKTGKKHYHSARYVGELEGRNPE
tara:strand:- start:113 stop:538 length:426 start_codon:yes stop_codon:yes gene_type:complete